MTSVSTRPLPVVANAVNSLAICIVVPGTIVVPQYPTFNKSFRYPPRGKWYFFRRCPTKQSDIKPLWRSIDIRLSDNDVIGS